MTKDHGRGEIEVDLEVQHIISISKIGGDRDVKRKQKTHLGEQLLSKVQRKG